MILVTKGGLSRGDYDMPENCLYDCRLRDTCLYVPRWADEETLLRLGTERSKGCPLKEIFEVPKEAEQTEPCDECVFVKGSGWCDNCNGKPKGLDALPNSRKAEQTEPQRETSTNSEKVQLEPQTDCAWGEPCGR